MPSPKQVTKPVVKPATRSFEQAGLDMSGGSKKRSEWDEKAPGGKAQPPIWFDSDKDEYSTPFLIVGAESSSFKGAAQVVLFLQDKNPEAMTPDEIYWATFGSNDTRAQFIEAFKTDETPIGPCVFQRIDTGQGMPFINIVEVSSLSDDDIPF